MRRPADIRGLDRRDARCAGAPRRDRASAAVWLDQIARLGAQFSEEQALAQTAIAANDVAALATSVHRLAELLAERRALVDAYVALGNSAETHQQTVDTR